MNNLFKENAGGTVRVFGTDITIPQGFVSLDESKKSVKSAVSSNASSPSVIKSVTPSTTSSIFSVSAKLKANCKAFSQTIISQELLSDDNEESFYPFYGMIFGGNEKNGEKIPIPFF